MKNILIVTIRGTTIGDSMSDEALIEKFKEEFPSSKIYYAGTGFVKQIFENNKKLKKYYEIEEFKYLSKNISKLKKIYYLQKGFFRLKKRLKSELKNIDIGIITSKKNNLGFFLSKLLFKSLNVKKVLVKGDLDYVDVPSKIYFSDQETKNFSRKFNDIILNKYVYVQIDASFKEKALTLNFISQIIKLFQDKKINLVIDGITSYGEKITSKEYVINTIGKTNVREAGFLMKNSLFAITNDSGLTHIGAASEADLIVLSPYDSCQIHYDKNKTKVIFLKEPSFNQLKKSIFKFLK